MQAYWAGILEKKASSVGRDVVKVGPLVVFLILKSKTSMQAFPKEKQSNRSDLQR